MSAEIKYRPEIDGLRAVAVLSVMLFHAGVPGFSGGFVGVDVFFVISGFLITGILLKELAADRFSLADFYERRARRILPALFFVLLFCLCVGWMVLDPYAFKSLGEALVATALFGSNILFWRGTSYFAAAFENPLLHTWSLGVEEQFYIFFPIFLWLVWRYVRRWLWCALILVALASLLISNWGVETGRNAAAFYLLPSRAFELLCGSLAALACFHKKLPVFRSAITDVLSLLGAALVCAAVVIFDNETPFPGWRALVPTVGTALILLYTRPESALGRLLTAPLLVGVGLVSYSAYLWHQPVFAFVRASEVNLGLFSSLGLILLCLAMAWVSWRFIERPFRDREYLSRQKIFWGAGAISVAVISIGAGLIATQGAKGRFTAEELRWFAYSDVALQSGYVTKRFDSLTGDFKSESAGRKVLIIGDSFAQDFTNMLYESGAWPDVEVRTVYIPSACQIALLPEGTEQYLSPPDVPRCSRESTVSSALPKIKQADIVVLAANWKKWSAQNLPRTLKAMGLRTDQKLFVIGPKEFGFLSASHLLQLNASGRLEARHTISENLSEVNDILRKEVPADAFVDQIQLICGEQEHCPVVTAQDHLISYDGKHLTEHGAKYIGNILFARSVLAENHERED